MSWSGSNVACSRSGLPPCWSQSQKRDRLQHGPWMSWSQSNCLYNPLYSLFVNFNSYNFIFIGSMSVGGVSPLKIFCIGSKQHFIFLSNEYCLIMAWHKSSTCTVLQYCSTVYCSKVITATNVLAFYLIYDFLGFIFGIICQKRA